MTWKPTVEFFDGVALNTGMLWIPLFLKHNYVATSHLADLLQNCGQNFVLLVDGLNVDGGICTMHMSFWQAFWQALRLIMLL
jgi:hypothetical protein